MDYIGANPNAPELVSINGAIATLADKIADHAVHRHSNFAKYQVAENNFRQMQQQAWALLQTCCRTLGVSVNITSFDQSASALVEAVNTVATHQLERRHLLANLNLGAETDFTTILARVREMRALMDAKPTLERQIASLEGDLRLERDRADGLQAEVERLTAELAKCKEEPAEAAVPTPAPASNAFGGWESTPEGEPFRVALRRIGCLVEMQVLEQPGEWTGREDIESHGLRLGRLATPALNLRAVFLRGKDVSEDGVVCQRHFETPDYAISYAYNVRALIARANVEWKAKKQSETDAKTGGATP